MKHEKTIESLGSTEPTLYFIENTVRQLPHIKCKSRYGDQVPCVKVGLSGISNGNKNKPKSYCWRVLSVCKDSSWYPEIKRLYKHPNNNILVLKQAESEIKRRLQTWHPDGLVADNRTAMSTEVFMFNKKHIRELLNIIDGVAVRYNLVKKPIVFPTIYEMYCYIEGYSIPRKDFLNYLKREDKDKIFTN